MPCVGSTANNCSACSLHRSTIIRVSLVRIRVPYQLAVHLQNQVVGSTADTNCAYSLHRTNARVPPSRASSTQRA